jgi:carbon storage regulator
VKVGIKAPKSIPVYREEVYAQIKEANKEAASDAVQENLKNLFK